MLLNFQRKNVLDSESSGNESDVVEQDAVELINHSNILIKTDIKIRIAESINRLSDQMERKEKEITTRLLRGIFLKTNVNGSADNVFARSLDEM